MERTLQRIRFWWFTIAIFFSMGGWPSLLVALPIQGSVFVKPIVVQSTGSDFVDLNIDRDFQFANRIYNQIGIKVNQTGMSIITHDDPGANNNWTFPEFRDDLVQQRRGDSNFIHAYYVKNYGDPGLSGNLGRTISEEDVKAPNLPLHPGVIIDSVRYPDTFAHELGHILVDEFRFKSKDSNDYGFHSNRSKDLMSTGNTPRSIPQDIKEIFPMGDKDQLPNLIGTLGSNGPNLFQINALYNQSSFLNDVVRDNFNINIDETSVSSDWGISATLSDMVDNTITVTEVARKVENDLDEISFLFEGENVFASSENHEGSLEISITDIDWLDEAIVDDVNSVSIFVESETGDLTELTSNNDFFFDFLSDQGNLGFNLSIGKEALIGKTNIEFVAQVSSVPLPSAYIVFLSGLAGLMAVARRKAIWGENYV